MDKIELKANLHHIIDQLDSVELLKKYYNELKGMVKNPKSSSWDNLSLSEKEDVLLAFEESEAEQYLIDNQEIENKLKKEIVKIRWTARASKNLDKILDYLEDEWDIKTVQKFAAKLLSFLETLKTKPEIGKIVEKDKKIRAFVLTKQNTIFYRIKGQQIIVLQLFDNRMNPKKRLLNI